MSIQQLFPLSYNDYISKDTHISIKRTQEAPLRVQSSHIQQRYAEQVRLTYPKEEREEFTPCSDIDNVYKEEPQMNQLQLQIPSTFNQNLPNIAYWLSVPVDNLQLVVSKHKYILKLSNLEVQYTRTIPGSAIQFMGSPAINIQISSIYANLLYEDIKSLKKRQHRNQILQQQLNNPERLLLFFKKQFNSYYTLDSYIIDHITQSKDHSENDSIQS